MKTVLIGLSALALIILYYIKRALSSDKLKARGFTLRQKFDALGNIERLKKEDIIAKVGAPTSTTKTNDCEILQWSGIGFHIVISFRPDGNIKHVTRKMQDSGL